MEKKKGTCIDHVAHATCGSSDGVAVYQHEDGTVDGYCWPCETYVKDPYNGGQAAPAGPVTQTRSTGQMFNMIHMQLQPGAIPHRQIDAGIASYFGVKVGMSTSNRMAIDSLYYPRTTDGTIVAYKQRVLADKGAFPIHKAGSDSGKEFFGQHLAVLSGARRLYMTEGEDDCMAVFKALWDGQAGTQYEGMKPAVVSLPDGSKSVGKSFKANAQFLAMFDELIIVFDNDEPGIEAMEEASRLLPPKKAKHVLLPKNDPCEMVTAGLGDAMRKMVLFKAQDYKPSCLVSVADVLEEACKPPVWGPSWPWPTLTKWTYGQQDKMIVGVAAGVGIGKTNWMVKVIEHNTRVHDEGVGLIMLEQPPAVTLKHIASKIAKVDFTRPDIVFDRELFERSVQVFTPHLTLFNHKGYKSWDDILAAIRHMVLVDLRKTIIVDPVTALVSKLSGSEANDCLNSMFSDIASLTQELDFRFIYGAHLNPPSKDSKPHEEGGRVKENQITGSRAMIKWSNYIIGLERNKQADDELEKNTTTQRLLKDREFGRSGTFPTYYDHETRDYYEIQPVQETAASGKF